MYSRRPYPSLPNPTNIRLQLSDVRRILGLFDVHEEPRCLKLYQQAFIHTSYVGKATRTKPGVIPLVRSINETNQRLEFKGDAALGYVVASYLYERFPDKDEGFMTKVKSKLVRTRFLNYFARKLNFDKYLWISKSNECKSSSKGKNVKGRTYNKSMEDAFEAFVGALCEDLGHAVMEKFIRGLLGQYVDWTDIIMINANYKHQFLEFCQERFKIQPTWHLESVEGTQTDPVYVVCVTDNMGNVVGRGRNPIKLEAEHAASKQALLNFGVAVSDRRELNLSVDPRLKGVPLPPRAPLRRSKMSLPPKQSIDTSLSRSNRPKISLKVA